MTHLIDLTHKQFGDWTVINRAENDGVGQSQWLCECGCGTRRVMRSRHLREGASRSCGCQTREAIGRARATHGHSRQSGWSPTYRVWAAMLSRCTNPKQASYPNYGGRGIRVCNRWRKFENFLADMGEKPSGLSIDRINNDGHYEPGNCRWTTTKVQNRNYRRNHLLTLNGTTMTIVEWAEHLGVSSKADTSPRVARMECRTRLGYAEAAIESHSRCLALRHQCNPLLPRTIHEP